MKRYIKSSSNELTEDSRRYIRTIIKDAKNNVLDTLGPVVFNDRDYDLGYEINQEVKDWEANDPDQHDDWFETDEERYNVQTDYHMKSNAWDEYYDKVLDVERSYIENE